MITGLFNNLVMLNLISTGLSRENLAIMVCELNPVGDGLPVDTNGNILCRLLSDMRDL